MEASFEAEDAATDSIFDFLAPVIGVKPWSSALGLPATARMSLTLLFSFLAAAAFSLLCCFTASLRMSVLVWPSEFVPSLLIGLDLAVEEVAGRALCF